MDRPELALGLSIIVQQKSSSFRCDPNMCIMYCSQLCEVHGLPLPETASLGRARQHN